VGKNSCIAPGVAVGRGAGASVSGKEVGTSKGIGGVLSGVITGVYVDVKVAVGEDMLSCGVDIWPAAGAQPDRMIIETGRSARKRFMVYWLDAVLKWMWV
jgi:hypothetical protein